MNDPYKRNVMCVPTPDVKIVVRIHGKAVDPVNRRLARRDILLSAALMSIASNHCDSILVEVNAKNSAAVLLADVQPAG